MSQDKPLSSDPEQRRNDTRASRYQSGLPPEEDAAPQGEEKSATPNRAPGSAADGASDSDTRVRPDAGSDSP